jgi:hypothetical protein
LGVPLLCHPNSNGEITDSFDNFFTTHVLGRVKNCTPALVLGGVFECSAERPLYGMHRVDDDWEWTIGFPQIFAILKWRPQSTLSETAM